MRPRLLALMVFAVAVGACGAESVSTPFGVDLLVETAPADGCMDALATGRLVPDQRSGLGIDAGGSLISVMWPFGYSAVYAEDTLWLVDPAGLLIASEGDLIQMGGGSGRGGLFYACSGSIERVN